MKPIFVNKLLLLSLSISVLLNFRQCTDSSEFEIDKNILEYDKLEVESQLIDSRKEVANLKKQLSEKSKKPEQKTKKPEQKTKKTVQKKTAAPDDSLPKKDSTKLIISDTISI